MSTPGQGVIHHQLYRNHVTAKSDREEHEINRNKGMSRSQPRNEQVVAHAWWKPHLKYPKATIQADKRISLGLGQLRAA